ncbi:MAG: DNA-binding domain-containing protein [Nitratireductor sp.]
MRLSELQARMQADILTRSTGIVPRLKVPSGTDAAKRLGVYQDAYKLRLIDMLATYHPVLLTYMGDAAFNTMANAYFDQFPSSHANARNVARRLPNFLQAATDYHHIAALAEIASLERAIEDVFDAPDTHLASLADLQHVDPQSVETMQIVLAPAMEIVSFTSNGYDIFLALKQGNDPPPHEPLEEPANVLVWRSGENSAFPLAGSRRGNAAEGSNRRRSALPHCAKWQPSWKMAKHPPPASQAIWSNG